MNDIPIPVFPDNKDLYTPTELAAIMFNEPLSEVSPLRVHFARLRLLHAGVIEKVLDGRLIRVPNGPLTRLWSVRNHKRYSTLEIVKGHLKGVTVKCPHCGGVL